MFSDEKKMRRKRIIWWIISALFLFFLFLYLGREMIFRWAIGRLGRKEGIEIKIGKIGGNIFSNFSVSDLRLSFPKGIIFTARSLKVRYHPVNLLRRREIISLFLREPEIFIPKTERGGLASPVAFPFSFRIENLFIQKGKIPLLGEYGFFDFEGKIIFSREGIRIEKGEIKTKQGEINFTLNYNFLSQEGNLDITSLTFIFEGKPWFSIAGGNLSGELVFTLREKGILGLPKINGEIKITLSSFSIKNFPFAPCSLALNFSDSIFSYRIQAISQKFGFLKGEGILRQDTTYDCHLSLSNFDLKGIGDLLKINLPWPKVSGELRVKGKGEKEASFSSDFRTLNLNLFRMWIMGKVSNLFTKRRMVVIREGKITRLGGSISFAGRLGMGDMMLNFAANNFNWQKGEIPFRSFREVSGRINGTGEVKGSFDSLSLRSSFSLSPFVLGNLMITSCSLNLSSPNIFSLRGEGKTKWQEFRWGKIYFDSLNLFWQEKDVNLFVFKSKDTNLEVGLRFFSFSPSTFSLNFNKLQCRMGEDSIFNLQEFYIERVGDSLSLKNLALRIGGGEIRGNLTFLPNKQIRGRLILSNLVLEKFLKTEKIKGIVNGSLLLDTAVTSQMVIEGLTLPEEMVKINEVRVELKLKEVLFPLSTYQRLELKDVSFVNQGKTSHLSGEVIFGKGKIEHWDISATLNDPGPWVFFFLKKTLHLQEGKIFGQVHLRGNPFRPNLDGRVRINKGKLFFPALRLLINDFSSELSLFQDEIILLEGKGKVDRGEISGSGFVKLKGFTAIDTLHYDVEFHELPMSLEKGIFGIFIGKTTIDWKPSSPLQLAGNLSVKEGLINVPFGKKVSRASGGEEINFDFKVEGDRGIWFRNQNADLELGINLRVKKEREEMILIGELVTKRGQLYYLDRVLQMKEGRIIFDNISEIDPQLDLRAELETKPIRCGDNLPQRFKIIFSLRGTLSQPEFILSSEPPLLSENDIITYLTLNVAPEELKIISEREFFYAVLSERILSYFEREIAKKMRGYLSLDYLSLEQGLGEKGRKITVGKYVSRNFYLTYSAVVGGEERDEYKAEYYLTRHHLFSAEKTAEGRYIVKYQFQIRY
ncbi:MAG: translocation/assembly module TamB domain-containing protein [candidate division WOR-3 bacterium]